VTQLTAPVPTRPPAGIPGEDPGGADLDAVASWATEIAREGVRSIEQVHGAVAGRVFGALGRTLGPSAAPSRVLHDGIAGGVYAAVRGGVTAAGFAARAYAALRPEPLEVGTGRRGGHVWGALAGAFGDHLDSHHPGLAPEMAVRIDGRDVPATPEALRAAFPDAAGHVVVFLHGLCETEDAWGFHAGITWGDPGETYGRQLARAGDWTPVYVRYNTGLHVSENGRRLGALLYQLVTAWRSSVTPWAAWCPAARCTRPVSTRPSRSGPGPPARSTSRWTGPGSSATWSRSGRRTWAPGWRPPR
jgi:hypothetical protein